MSLQMLGAEAASNDLLREEDADALVAEARDDLEFPRQGFPSFRASPMEIDAQPRVLRSLLNHYPDLFDLEHRPWGVNAPEDLAFDWSGISPTAEVLDEGEESLGLEGALPGVAFFPAGGPASAAPVPAPSPALASAVNPTHGHHHGWPGVWGGPWVDWGPYLYERSLLARNPIEIDEPELDADTIADLVAEKVAEKVAAKAKAQGLGLHMLGAAGIPALSQLQPYFLTEYPTTGEKLVAIYEGYLRAYDALVDDVFSVRHPVSSGAVATALRAARKKVEELWEAGGASSIMAVQMLAGILGWFNANYRDPYGAVVWSSLNQPVNAAIIEGAHGAAQAAVDTAKAAGKSVGDTLKRVAETAWWTTALLVLGGLAVVALLGWRLLGSDAGRAAMVRYLPGKR